MEKNKRAGMSGRPPHRAVGISLPVPPLAGPEYIGWLDAVRGTITRANLGEVPGLVSVAIRAGISERPRDLDGITRPILDVLASLGVIEGHAKATRIISEWSTEIPRGTVAVDVRQLSAPEVRFRYAEAARGRSSRRASAGASAAA